MDNEEDTCRKSLFTGVLLVNTWRVFLTFRQISFVVNTQHVPRELSKMSQWEFEVYRNIAVVGLIGKVFQCLWSTVATILRIVRGYPASIWSITAEYQHIVGNRVVCYTIVESVLANWLAVVLINLGLLLAGNVAGIIVFNVMTACIVLLSAALTYLLVIATKLLGPGVLLYIAVPMNLLETLYIVLLIQFVLPSFCHSLPRGVADSLNPTAELVNYPVSKICMIPESSSKEIGPNAAFIGIWGYKMIIITESLLKSVGLSNTRSVLAHELGHWIRGHTFVLVACHLAQTLLFCFVLALCYGSTTLFKVFGFEDHDPPHPAVGVLVGLQYVIPLFHAVTKGFSTMLTYFNEYQADHFAVDLGLGLGLESALLTLVGGMKQFPLFDSWFAAWFVGHPDVLDRVHRILSDIQ